MPNDQMGTVAFLSQAPASKRFTALDQVLLRLRAKITGGTLLPGEQIRQQEMADELGVSRVPLREALALLADQGLLLHRPNQGYFVAKRPPNEQAQVRRMLQLLENELLMSIDWPDEGGIQRLEQLNAAMAEKAREPDWAPLIRLNREFHETIFGWSPYHRIFVEVVRLWAVAEPVIAMKMSSPDARLRTVQEHDRIIEALRQRDLAQSLATFDEHRRSTSVGLPPELPDSRPLDVTQQPHR